MANESANPNISEIQTKNGSVYDVAAKRFSGNRTIEFNGDVTANETGWDGSGKLEVSTTISDGAVGEGKIADSAVTNAKVADGAVNWDKIASSVKNGTIAGNYTEKLATCAQVKTYVDEAITGHGSYLGQKSVAEVNALTGMNNGDHVSVSDAGSITNPDGTSTSVNAGDNVIYDGTLRKWDCLAGDYKVKQTAKELENTDSTKTISKVTQNENGEVSVTYQTIGKVATAGTADKVNVGGATAGSWYNVVGASGTGDKSLVDAPKIVYQYSTNDGCALGLGDTTTSGNSASGKLILASSNANARHLVYSGATTSKILSLGDKSGTILVESDVDSTYSSTGTAPVNGKAVASAIASATSNRTKFRSPASNQTKVFEYAVPTDYMSTFELKVNILGDGAVGCEYFITGSVTTEGVPTIRSSLTTTTNTGQFANYANIYWMYTSESRKLEIAVQTPNYYDDVIVEVAFCRKHSHSENVSYTLPTTGVALSSTTNAVKPVICATSTAGTATGSSSVPVFVESNGKVTACTTADIKAGKDGSGNTITSTYATKTEVNSKFGLTASLLTSRDDLDTLYRSYPGVDYYKWTYTDHPDNIPEIASGATCLMKLTRKHQANAYCTQEIEVAGTMEYYFIRQSMNGRWGDWERVYRNPRKSDDVASLTTDDERAYTGKAIADHVSNAISGKEDTYNKVTSWSATTTDTNYPSEKLVKDSLDGKSYLKAKIVDSASSIDDLRPNQGVEYYCWVASNRPTGNLPDIINTCVLVSETINASKTSCIQKVYSNDNNTFYWLRCRTSSDWDSTWTKVYYVDPELTTSDIDALWAE